MRQERDSLGEWMLSDDEYFGIGTARIVSAIKISGPCIPLEIGANIIRIRQAQAIAYEKLGKWSPRIAAAIQATTTKMLAQQLDWPPSLRINSLHGGGARSYITNVDEVIINFALVENNNLKGDYHLFGELLQLNTEVEALKTFGVATHVALIECIDTAIAVSSKTIDILRIKSIERNCQETVARIHFQELKLTDMGSEFHICADSLMRLVEQMKCFQKRLRSVWLAPQEVLLVLQEEFGVVLEQSTSSYEFPLSSDLYIGLSSLAKTLATTILNFCTNMRFYVGMTKELVAPRIRVGPSFNPTAGEMVILESISQSAFHVIGCDAVIGQAVTSGKNGTAAYFPQIAAKLIGALNVNTEAIRLLADKFLPELTGNLELGKKLVEASLLQAEKLIPLLGYERAVQVARIAALTEKPVKTVVVKMKMMTEQQADTCFSSTPNML